MSGGKTKKKISKPLRKAVWETWAGSEHSTFNCGSCYTKISVWDFECGHIIPESKNGETKIGNLIPVCGLCNKSMGVINVDEFRKRMNDSGVINSNIQLNSTNCNTVILESGHKNIEPKLSLENLSKAELNKLCEFYNVPKGDTKADHINNIKSSPKFNEKNFYSVNRLRKVLLTVKQESLHLICDHLILPKIGTDLQLIAMIVLNSPNFDYIEFCSNQQKPKTKKSTQITDAMSKIQVNSEKSRSDVKDIVGVRSEFKNNQENKSEVFMKDIDHKNNKKYNVIKYGFDIEFIPFSANNNDMAILTLKNDDSTWIRKFPANELTFMTTSEFDLLVISDVLYGSGGKPTFISKNNVMIINLSKDGISYELFKSVELSKPLNSLSGTKNKCCCKDCDERLTKLESFMLEFSKNN